MVVSESSGNYSKLTSNRKKATSFVLIWGQILSKGGIFMRWNNYYQVIQCFKKKKEMRRKDKNKLNESEKVGNNVLNKGMLQKPINKQLFDKLYLKKVRYNSLSSS